MAIKDITGEWVYPVIYFSWIVGS